MVLFTAGRKEIEFPCISKLLIVAVFTAAEGRVSVHGDKWIIRPQLFPHHRQYLSSGRAVALQLVQKSPVSRLSTGSRISEAG